MKSVEDLNLTKEILPFFDYCLNKYTKRKLEQLFNSPLDSIDNITKRQNILKAFIGNIDVVLKYNYPTIYLEETHEFLTVYTPEEFKIQRRISEIFRTSQDTKRFEVKCNELIIFFAGLYSNCFSQLRIELFPEEYQNTIQRITGFITFFDIQKYEDIIKTNGLRRGHLLDLQEKIVSIKNSSSDERFWEELFFFECLLSISKGIYNSGFIFPKFGETGIKILGLYHPYLKFPVKNDFVTDKNITVVNGPNMSGKSTFLKSVGLCVYLGHLGLAIPARAAIFPYFENFLITLNKRDDLVRGYSHFMSEVINLKSIIECATKGESCFAIFDELFSGTNIEDGLEVSKITIKGLNKFQNSYFFIATHIQELKLSCLDVCNCVYLACDITDNVPEFSYKLKTGWSEVRVGQVLFENIGLSKLLS